MHDERGLYYHPEPGNTKARVYVRRGTNGEVEFRLWQADHEHVWEQHQWLPAEVLCAAAALYKEHGRITKATDPMRLYDIGVANALLKEAGL